MQKSTKGAIAAGAAAALLLGGAGTLAYWNAEGDIAGAELTTGTLKLNEEDAGKWTLNGQEVTGTPVVVPGDELVWTGSYEIEATGDNIQGDLTVPALNSEPWTGATVTSSFTLDGTTVQGTQAIDGDDNGKVVEAEIQVDFPFGTSPDNSSQGQRADLSAVKITLEQTDATPTGP
ncbi:alternate-type signal peptide domain-containing protein [Aeromicrobium duanguangcaii]|uniref:alternate-type signal peptide domain-containing protein n=1 Tax=Aeromicrobium duanguangcaii TaxID=2968086 RepID=UPI002016F36C|nr:alternate-type signal peptide domain-containing protein [Aeromicrobium duanguangcaii]MCL3836916.1 alternate-type signal peptide domain-containing protein [Aeromicrobium duanguangcaii]